jgi:hypothetical protein
MNRRERIEAWRQEEQQPFTGWDFSYLDGRMVEAQLPWSYLDRAGALMGQSSAVLDRGTGGAASACSRCERIGRMRWWSRKTIRRT